MNFYILHFKNDEHLHANLTTLQNLFIRSVLKSNRFYLKMQKQYKKPLAVCASAGQCRLSTAKKQ